MGPPNYYFRGFIPTDTRLQPWFFWRVCWGYSYLITRGAPSCRWHHKKNMLSLMSFCLDTRPCTSWLWWIREVVEVEQLIGRFWHSSAVCACMEVWKIYVVRGTCASTTFLHINSFCFMAFECTNLKVPRVYFASSDWACLGYSFAAFRGKYNPVKPLDLSRSLDRFSMFFSNWILEIPTNVRA